MKVCVVTCTGGRNALLHLCEKWVERQTRRPDLWLITDDLPKDTIKLRPQLFPILLRGIKQPEGKTWTERAHRTLSRALNLVPPEHHVVIMEDDDWYPSNYVEVMADYLDQGAPLAGCLEERRYNLPAQAWWSCHPFQVNAGCTAIHANEVARYADIVRGDHGSDHAAWKQMRGATQDIALRVAIKGVGYGLPGRIGATSKHNPMSQKVQRWIKDENWKVLRKWLGPDAEEYINLCTQLPDASSLTFEPGTPHSSTTDPSECSTSDPST